MGKEIIINLVLNHYKFDLLSRHARELADSDIYYDDLKLNEPSFLLDIFKIVGFPFFGNEVKENQYELYRFLYEYYFDNIFSIDHKSKQDLLEAIETYSGWLFEQKVKFDKGSINYSTY